MTPAAALPSAPLFPDDRRRFGRYYTPPPLVAAVHRLLAEGLTSEGLDPRCCSLVDPSCGPGAFLEVPEAGTYRARLGLDLDREALAQAARAAPDAALLEGDAYIDGRTRLEALLGPDGGPVAVIGNPPYVANSELLRSGRYHEVRDALLPFAREVARGTSIRDDYALFFGVADRLIEATGGRGAIAFVTSATFVDNFLYAPMRRWLLSRYRLHALVELGPGLFEGARVATAISVWVRTPGGHGDTPFAHARLGGEVEDRFAALAGPLPLAPARPHGEALLLNALDGADARLLETMRRHGDPVSAVFPVSLPGLKTRFEELLVDDERDRLEQRMRDFFEAPDPAAFAARHGIPERARDKLADAFRAREQTRFARSALRRFARYAGRPHRFRVPDSAMAWAYVDPKLIPRGDHRFRGAWDPHARGPKLVFNVREVPLCAAVVDGPVCIHTYRHARFAPLEVPGPILAGALRLADASAPLVPNLAPAWRELAGALRDPSDLLYYVAAIFNSELVQKRFAPLVGATEEVPIPGVGPGQAKAVQRLADLARALGAGGDLPAAGERLVRRLFDVHDQA